MTSMQAKDRVINKYYSYYLHLNSIASLSEGDVVSKGTAIGTMGQTGGIITKRN